MTFNGKYICPNCFRERTSPGGPCPHCGYTSPAENPFPQALGEGTVLSGHYLLGRVLGQGGFGITYLAWDLASGRKLALKEYFPQNLAHREPTSHRVIPFSSSQEENYRYGLQQFLAEAGTLSQFTGCRNIVAVYACFEEMGTAYFTMEYLEGLTFKEHMDRRGGRLSWEETLSVLLPTMDALEAVHSRGMVHRDVAPDNIFITREGTVKLLDFGAARYSLGDRSFSLDVILKHGFAPKEQYTRRGRQGPFTDMYALGACFYMSLTGRVPPDAMDRLDEDELVLPSTLGVHLPQGVQETILKALEVRAEDRFQNIAQFRAALLNRPTVAAPGGERLTEPSKPPQPPKPAANMKLLIGALSGAVCLLVVILAVVLATTLGGAQKTVREEDISVAGIREEPSEAPMAPTAAPSLPAAIPEATTQPTGEEPTEPTTEPPTQPTTEAPTVPTVEKLEWLSGEYSGQILDGEPQGEGSLVWSTGVYTGSFEAGYPKGRGTFTPEGEDPVTGSNWSYGKRTIRFDEGPLEAASYQGLILDGEAWGFGLMQTEDFGIYLGNFAQDRPQGWGAYQFLDKSDTVVGFWTWERNVEDSAAPGRLGAAMYYTGMLCDGAYQGVGMLVFEKCGTFCGEFRDGDVKGTGTYFFRCPGSKTSVSGDNWSFARGEVAYSNTYYGLKLGSQWTGFGIGIMSSGNHYAGEVLYDYRDGYGRVFLQNQNVDPNLRGIFRAGTLVEKME